MATEDYRITIPEDIESVSEWAQGTIERAVYFDDLLRALNRRLWDAEIEIFYQRPDAMAGKRWHVYVKDIYDNKPIPQFDSPYEALDYAMRHYDRVRDCGHTNEPE